MVYFCVKTLDDPVFDDSIPVFISTGDGKTSEYFFRNPTAFSEISEDVDGVSVIWLPSYNRPVITFSPKGLNPDKITNLTDVYGVYVQALSALEKAGMADKPMPEQLKNKIMGIISKRYSENDGQLRIKLLEAQRAYENAEPFDFTVHVNSSLIEGSEESEDFAVATRKQIRKHNEQFRTVFKSISDVDNSTLHQNECTDELFIEIPSATALLSIEPECYSALIPNRRLVCTPYTDANAYSPGYKKLVAPHLLPVIEGDSRNNFLPVQENEKKYCQALTEWIEYNIKQEFGVEGDIIDEMSKAYLEELADNVYAWHWGHNPNTPVNFVEDTVDTDVDSDDKLTAADNENVNTSLASRYSFRENSDGRSYDNAVLFLNKFLENASASLGYKVYPEAIVKIARWGSRKAKALAFDGYPYIFDFGTNTVEHNVGQISDYEVTLSNGKQYKAEGVIVAGVTAEAPSLQDGIDYGNEPIGVLLRGLMTHKETGRQIGIPVCYSMWDLINLVQSGELSVDGIDWDGSGFVYNPDILKEVLTFNQISTYFKTNASVLLQNPFWRSQELKDLCISFGTAKTDAEQNLMAICVSALSNKAYTDEVKAFALKDISELKAKVADFTIYSTAAALNVNVASVLLPVVKRVTELRSEGEEWLAAWDKALDGWKGINSFYVLDEPAQQIQQPVPGPSHTPAINAFGSTAVPGPVQQSAQKTVQQEVAQQQVQNSLQIQAHQPAVQHLTGDVEILKEFNPHEPVAEILSPDGKVIGAYAKKQYPLPDGRIYKEFILLDLNDLASADPSKVTKTGVNILKILPYFIKDLTYIANGRASSMPIRFSSKESAIYYERIIADICSKVLSGVLGSR